MVGEIEDFEMATVRKIKSQEEYVTRNGQYAIEHSKWKAMVIDDKIDEEGQIFLKWLNREYAVLRQWEKAHQIYRFDPVKIGNITFQCI